jgi:hypothetical protein
MVALLFFLLRLLISPFRPISRLEAENAALRRQLIVLQCQVRGRVQFTNSDRPFFIQLYRWFPSIMEAMTTIRPRRWCDGIAQVSASIGAGNPGTWETGHQSASGACGAEKPHPFLFDEQLEIGSPKRTDFRLCLGSCMGAENSIHCALT